MRRGDNRGRAPVDTDSTGKSSAIDRVIQEIIRQRNAGVAIDDAAVQAEHPELMPELGERLHFLRGIEAAAEEAQQAKSSSDPEGGMGTVTLCKGILQSKLPGYELLEVVHSGGQGIVFRAVQLAANRMVAIKVLLYGPFASAQQRRRFSREVELISRLEHPHIVTLYDSGEVVGLHYFAMEFVEGLPIDDYALLYALSVKAVVQLLLEVCDAIGHAHQRGVIHRDIKPSNVVVDADGVPHVLDFGLAKTLTGYTLADNMPSISMAGQVLGTLPYLSPEQAAGIDQAIDVRSDIYSLGVLLHHLLTDDYPYPVDGTPDQVRANIASQVPRPVRRAVRDEDSESRFQAGDISRDLEAVVLKTLEKDKARRYQSVYAMADDLRRYLSGEAVQARGTNRLYLLRKSLYRHRVAFSVGAAVLMAIGVVIGVVGHLAFKAREAAATGALRADMARVNTLSLLHRFQTIESNARHEADAVALPAEFREIYARRYAGPKNEPDERFDALTEDMPANLLDIASDPDHPEHALAQQWFLRAAPRLNDMARTLATSTLYFPPTAGASSSYVAGSGHVHVLGARRLCEAYLARAHWRFGLGDLRGAMDDLLALRRLGVDLSDAIFSHHSIGHYYRLRTYTFVLDAYRQLIPASGVTSALYEWAVTDPAQSNASSAFLRDVLYITQLVDDSAVTDLDTGERYIDLDHLDALCAGSLSSLNLISDGSRRAVRSVSPAEFRSWVERFYTMQENWDALTYTELCHAIGSFKVALDEAREQNPIFYLLSYRGNSHRGTLFDKTIRRVTRLVAFATAFRQEHGQWPERLCDAVPPGFSADLTDPVTGREFVYDLWNGMPRLRSALFDEPLPEDRWLDDRRYMPIDLRPSDENRFTYFSFDGGK